MDCPARQGALGRGSCGLTRPRHAPTQHTRRSPTYRTPDSRAHREGALGPVRWVAHRLRGHCDGHWLTPIPLPDSRMPDMPPEILVPTERATPPAVVPAASPDGVASTRQNPLRGSASCSFLPQPRRARPNTPAYTRRVGPPGSAVPQKPTRARPRALPSRRPTEEKNLSRACAPPAVPRFLSLFTPSHNLARCDFANAHTVGHPYAQSHPKPLKVCA